MQDDEFDIEAEESELEATEASVPQEDEEGSAEIQSDAAEITSAVKPGTIAKAIHAVTAPFAKTRKEAVGTEDESLDIELEENEFEAMEAIGPEEEDKAAAEVEHEVAKAIPAVKPGPIARAIDAISAPLANIKLPTWDFRFFAWLLLVLIVVVFFWINWSPMRIYFFGLSVDIPKSLMIIILLVVGFLVGRFGRFPKDERAEEIAEK